MGVNVTYYHVDRNGNTAVCTARPGNCPLGGKHFTSRAECDSYAESLSESNASKGGNFLSIKRDAHGDHPRAGSLEASKWLIPRDADGTMVSGAFFNDDMRMVIVHADDGSPDQKAVEVRHNDTGLTDTYFIADENATQDGLHMMAAVETAVSGTDGKSLHGDWVRIPAYGDRHPVDSYARKIDGRLYVVTDEREKSEPFVIGVDGMDFGTGSSDSIETNDDYEPHYKVTAWSPDDYRAYRMGNLADVGTNGPGNAGEILSTRRTWVPNDDGTATCTGECMARHPENMNEVANVIEDNLPGSFKIAPPVDDNPLDGFDTGRDY